MTGNRQKPQELELGPRVRPSSPLKGKGLGAATVKFMPTFRSDYRPPRALGRVSAVLIPANALSILRCRRSPSDFRNACGF